MIETGNRLIWIDLEMTGLNPEHDVILEIATIVTDNQLNILAQGPVLAIHQADAILAAMDEWNQTHHGRSGLINRVKISSVTIEQAEQQTLQFLQQWVKAGDSPICGNSIAQDRRFLYRYMPQLESFFHYRHLDVSTLKELVNRWKPELKSGLTKQSLHIALADIQESIAELKYYREHFLKT
jgi:oligoribonuclease